MNAKDLRVDAPRRWSERIAGVCWLPRLIDKTRAALAGTLGTYLYGQRPIDRGLLHALGVSHDEFAAIVLRAVVTALDSRDGASLSRARAWSDRLVRRQRAILWLLDVDDGYCASRLRAPIAFGADAVAGAMKRIWPWHAAGRR
ncbi:MAG TPA: DUF5069 domain-containing protein [Candidatus Tumulicola sp.]|jgi:hypothetical protein